MTKSLQCVLILLCFTFSVSTQAADVKTGEPQAKLVTAPLTITTQDGATHQFTVELAKTKKERTIGLMHREVLGDSEGMLFITPYNARAAMWMKHTYIPLDMLFISEDGVIQHIHHQAKPHSLAIIQSPKPVNMTLEIAGGIAKKYAIQKGDKVTCPDC